VVPPGFPSVGRLTCVRLLAFLGAVLVSASATAQEQADLAEDAPRERIRVSGSVRAGAEYDDNVFRLEGDDQEGGFLSRYFGALDVATPAAARSVVAFSLSHGGKFFFRDEHGRADTLLTQLNLTYRQKLWDPFGVWASADMKDRTEREPRRDYNRGGLGSGVEFYLGPATLRLGGAWRYFAFKPSSESSSSNGEGVVRANVDIYGGFEGHAGYTIARRYFDTGRFERDGDDLLQIEDELRRDTFHVGSLGVGYNGVVVADLGYNYAQNTSNSFGQGLRRHSLNVTLTAPLVWRLFASAHFELQRTTYDDPVLIDANFLIDEDNRNAAVLSLARAIGDHWEIEARYSLYLQEFGVGSDYRRQTMFVAGAYVFD
jgi:hypothetical protein